MFFSVVLLSKDRPETSVQNGGLYKKRVVKVGVPENRGLGQDRGPCLRRSKRGASREEKKGTKMIKVIS